MKKTAAPKRVAKKTGGPGPDFDGPEAAVPADGVGTPGGVDGLPGREEIAAAQAAVRAFMNSSGQARTRGFLERLNSAPPQVLLLEGGTPDERLAAAHYWSLLLNCPAVNGRADPTRERGAVFAGAPSALPQASPVTAPQSAPLALLQAARAEEPVRPVAPDLALPGLEEAGAGGESGSESDERAFAGPACEAAPPDAVRKAVPCLECPECIRMLTHLHRDCFFFDGLAGSIKIDEVRALRAVLGEPAREARCRVVILREAQALVEAAANALLKSLEEPRPGTSFILLAPQRERLLPTLVSRSFTLTLPWPWAEDARQRDRLAPWEAALCSFMQSGRDLFDRSGGKGAVDAALVHDLAGLCRRALAGRIRALQSGAPAGEGLETLLARLPARRLRMLDEALAECQDSLIYNVNPVLVLEWLATRMFLLLPRQAGGAR